MRTKSPILLVCRMMMLVLVLGTGAAQAMDYSDFGDFAPRDVDRYEMFGFDLALDGTTALIGAAGIDDGKGGAFIYRLYQDQWIEDQQLLTPIDSVGESAGMSVALDGDVAVVGAMLHNESEGAVYVYRLTGFVWVLEQTLVAGDSAEYIYFGSDVSVDGDVLLVGAFGSDTDEGGAAYVFRYDGSSWVEEQKINASDMSGGDEFGISVALEGNTAVVGANGGISSTGAAYVFRYDGSTWSEEQKLTALDGANGDSFGEAVTLEGSVALIGAPEDNNNRGAAYVFRHDGSSWSEEQKLTVSELQTNDFFGSAVVLNGGRALIGATSSNGSGANTGSSYLFRFDGASWLEEQELTGVVEEFDDFGNAVALEGDVALVAAVDYQSQEGRVFSFFSPSCMAGTVNLGAGSVSDVLLVNGSAGGASRRMEAPGGAIFLVTMMLPPAGGNGKFVLHANTGMMTPDSTTVLPFNVGASCFPFLLTAGASPVIIANNIGKTNQIGESHFFGNSRPNPERAEALMAYNGVGAGLSLTFQGIIIDPSSPSSKSASVTNAVIVDFVETP